ncbi:MAG: hypothetical protein P4L83_19770 [Nevskia sp.]|nr:hypothetical protein [Nevskia sp.]
MVLLRPLTPYAVLRALARVWCFPSLKSCIPPAAGSFSCIDKKRNQKKQPRSLRRSIAKEEARLIGALRFSPMAGSADRPSLA